ncbi:MAG: nucleotidyltransferase family protein [Chloroflexi bacterium]|nr:nucleotidyltransferase family protein [Chloroflexota bacterium]
MVVLAEKQLWTADEILAALSEHGAELRALGVRRIGLFGSYGRGSPTVHSDIDLLVTLDRSTFDTYMDVKLFLEDLFQRRVDLVLEKSLKPRLRPRIMAEVTYAQGV